MCHFDQVFLTTLVFVDIASNHVARTGPKETGSDECLGVARVKFVTGQLLEYKLVVGLVVIESADDVIAVAPGVRTFGVQFEAIGIGIADNVEPFLAEAFTVARAGHEAVDQAVGGTRTWVFEIGFDLSRSGWEASNVKSEPTHETAFFERIAFGGLERIDWILIGRGYDTKRGLKSPIIAAFCDKSLFFRIHPGLRL